jgi:integrase
MKTHSKRKWPQEITRGSVSVKIYRTLDKKGGDYYRYQVADYSTKKRVLRTFADFDDAKREAQFIADRMATGEHAALEFSSKDAVELSQARQMLAAVNVQLLAAVSEYLDARRSLPDGANLRDAAADYARRSKQVVESRTVDQCLDELLAAKVKKSACYLRPLTLRLKRFAAAHQMQVGALSRGLIQSYLDNLKTSGRTRQNELQAIGTLVRFAVRRRYAPRELIEDLEAVERPDAENNGVEIFTPAELREMLDSVRGELVPWIALGAFCGLRSAEILRLDWRDVNLERRIVTVEARKAKTRQRRTVPICEAAVQWLAPWKREEGRVACHQADNWFWMQTVSDVNAARREAGKPANFTWKRNALRHSFCSYRMALTADAARVSLEAGNSPQMIFAHYRELTTESEARAWFAVSPDAPANVVSMGEVAA